MQRAKVGIIGASGYSGVELTRILAGHSGVELVAVSSDRWVGETVARRTGVVGMAGMLRYVANDAADFGTCDVVLLATPAEASLALAPKLIERDVRVIDLSGAFRLRDAGAYPTWYGFAHAAPRLLASAAYGMPELGHRDTIAAAKLVANPGCYATAITLALAPLIAAGIVDKSGLIVDAMSGTTGAGRQAKEEHSFAEVDENARAYRIGKHQHTPEIAQTIGAPVIFTAHLVPLKRGILATAHATLAAGNDAASVGDVYEAIYGDEPFVTVAAAPEDVTLHAVVGTNRCAIGYSVVGNHVIVMSAIDNLLKGAAGQAVQNLNVLLGHPETTGLTGMRPHH